MKIIDNIIFIPWVLGLMNLFTPFSNIYFYWVVSITLYFLIIAHLAECIIFRKKIMNGPNGIIGFLLTFIYGVLYLRSFNKDS